MLNKFIVFFDYVIVVKKFPRRTVMRIDITTNNPHVFSPNQYFIDETHRSRAFTQSRYDVVEISEAARKRFEEMAKHNAEAEDTRALARSYEPLVREVLRQMEHSEDVRRGRISQLKDFYHGKYLHREDEILGEVVEVNIG